MLCRLKLNVDYTYKKFIILHYTTKRTFFQAAVSQFQLLKILLKKTKDKEEV